MEATFVALDLETSGLNLDRDAILEVAAVRYQGRELLGSFQSLVRPKVQVPLRIRQLTGLDGAELALAPLAEEVLPAFADFVAGAVLVGHSVGQDLAFLRRAGLALDQPSLDTFHLATLLLPEMERYGLGPLAEALGLEVEGRSHRALADAQMHRRLHLALLDRAAALPATLLAALAELAERHPGWTLGSQFLLATDWTAPAVLPAAAVHGRVAEDPATGEGAWGLSEVAQEPSLDPAGIAHLEAMLAPGGRLERLAPQSFEDRPAQRQMLLAVGDCLQRGGELMVEAGTGTGKTLAYLLPAAAMALAGERVLVATHTVALQEQIRTRDLPLVERLLGRPLGAALLKGRSHYLCRAALDRFLAGSLVDDAALRFAAKLLVWSRWTRDGDRAGLFVAPDEEALWEAVSAERCEGAACGGGRTEGPACWLASARAKAAGARLLLVNQALLLADAELDGGLLPSCPHLVVDEAHHLEDAATRALGRRLQQGRTQAVLKPLLEGGGPLTAFLQQAGPAAPALEGRVAAARAAADGAGQETAAFFVELGHALVEMAGGRGTRELLLSPVQRRQPAWQALEGAGERLWDSLGQVAAAIADLAEAGGVAGRHLEASLRQLAELQADLDALLLRPRRDHVLWIAQDDHGPPGLRGAPLRVDQQLRDRVYRDRRSVILTSATLRAGDEGDFLRDRLGLAEADTLVLDAPFDLREALWVLAPRDMPPPPAPEYQAALDQAIVQVALGAQGRTLVLFTAHSALRRSYHAVRQVLGEAGIAVIAQGIDGQRHQLVQTFRRAEHPLVLMGTRSFWEGIDIPGEALSALIMARLPFDVPSDPVIKARAEGFEDGFNDYTLPQSILRFRQGLGRLIRSRRDRGVAVILDSRIHGRGYGSSFQDALPDCRFGQPGRLFLTEAVKAALEGSESPFLQALD